MTLTYSEKHPHEPEIPPALDSEGRCYVCTLLVELEQAQQRILELVEGHAIQELTAELEQAQQALRDVENVRVVVEGPWVKARDIIGHVVADVRVNERTILIVLRAAEPEEPK